MSGTITGTIPALNAFHKECERFTDNMEKSRKRLENAILSARSGWRDGGFDSIQRMVVNVRQDVSEIEKTVTSKVIPFVDEQIKWIGSNPY